jgi:predicted cobalt transporter CbtA
MLTAHLRRGLVAGIVGGLVYGGFVTFVGNPLVAAAETFEAAHGGHGAGETVVSAATTATVSISAGGLWGLLFGLVAFGVAYYLLEPVIPGGKGTKSYVLGAAGFLVVSGAPWLVLPPQPPATEQALGTDARLVWYAGMMLAGAVAVGLSWLAVDRTRERGRGQRLLAGLTPFALLAVPVLLAPANPTHGPVPAALATAFRGTVVFGQLALWGTLATTHAWLVQHGTDDTTATLSTDDPRGYGAD